jgi:hypothetical protein
MGGFLTDLTGILRGYQGSLDEMEQRRRAEYDAAVNEMNQLGILIQNEKLPDSVKNILIQRQTELALSLEQIATADRGGGILARILGGGPGPGQSRRARGERKAKVGGLFGGQSMPDLSQLGAGARQEMPIRPTVQMEELQRLIPPQVPDFQPVPTLAGQPIPETPGAEPSGYLPSFDSRRLITRRQ